MGSEYLLFGERQLLVKNVCILTANPFDLTILNECRSGFVSNNTASYSQWNDTTWSAYFKMVDTLHVMVDMGCQEINTHFVKWSYLWKCV